MSNLKQREKLLRQARIETQALLVLKRAKNLLTRRHWFNGHTKDRTAHCNAICAQIAISEVGAIVKPMVVRRDAVTIAMDLVLAEANKSAPPWAGGGASHWISIPHWNDAQKYKKDVIKVFDTTIHNLKSRLQPV